MKERLPDLCLDQLFREARAFSSGRTEPPHSQVAEVCELGRRFGPTSANRCAALGVVLTTSAAKERLIPAVDADNTDNTCTSPLVALIAWGTEFYKHLPRLIPHGHVLK
jgi:3-hydroxypropanoate dehydrogenase